MAQEDVVSGHIISHKGIEVDKVMIEVIKRLPPPIRVKGWEASLDMRVSTIILSRFLKIAKHLNLLLARDIPYVFTNECLQAFHKVKETLITAPISQPPNWSLSFEIMHDASDHVMGVVLGLQKDKIPYVIYYPSKTLDKA